MASPARASNTDLPYVTASINYAGDIKGRARVDSLEPSRNNFAVTERQVRVHDASSMRDGFDLDREGFASVDHVSDVLRPLTVQEIVREQENFEYAYHDELEQALCTITKADVMIPHRYGLTVRVSKGQSLVMGNPLGDTPVSEKTGMPLVYEPALMAHADYTAKSFQEHVDLLHKRENVPLRPYRRAALYHVWRLLTPGPQDKPLAVSDGRTAQKDGHVVMDAVTGPEEIAGNVFETRIAPNDPDIAWYYFSQATKDQIIIFKGFDTAFEEQTVYHTAFHDPTTGARAIPRASIETRIFAFWK